MLIRSLQQQDSNYVRGHTERNANRHRTRGLRAEQLEKPSQMHIPAQLIGKQ